MVNGRGDFTRDKVILASYGKGTIIPAERYTYDVSRFRDPAGAKVGTFKGANSGLDPDVQDWMLVDPRITALVVEVASLAHMHLAGGESYVSFAFVDRQGKWISPAVAELIADVLVKAGFSTATRHFALSKEEI